MKQHHIRQNLYAVLAAFIWGTSFVAQSVGADYVGPFTFNAARSLVAFAFLLSACLLYRKFRKATSEQSPGKNPHYYRDLLMGGIFCGAILSLGTNLQQKGLETTASGKAGFITALYIIIVPILGLFLKRKVPWTIWISIGIAAVGLYFLCIKDHFSVQPGDLYTILCSFCFAIQILLVDHYAQRVNGIDLSCAQFLVVSIISLVGMAVTETPTWTSLHECIWSVLYVGILSSGIAYTLQILAQRDSNPTVVSLLMSLEAVFATLAGALVLHDHMAGREYLGCGLMLFAVILAQIPAPEIKKKSPAKTAGSNE